MKKTKKIASARPSLLGIECGGTRTVALLVTGEGQTVQSEFGPANLRLMNDGDVVARFEQVRAFQASASASLGGIAIGMAGARTEEDRQRIRLAAAKVWPAVPCYATNDLEPALAAAAPSHGSRAQVLILSGTGSCCFGRQVDGKTVRFGGWGHFLGDRGSGYDIGLRALKSVVYHLDLDGTWSSLGSDILRALQLNAPEGLIDWVKNADKTQVAALAKNVFNAAANRDALAREILAEVAGNLARDGAACARLLAGKKAVDFVLSGSNFQKQPTFARQVRASLNKIRPGASVTVLDRNSVWGCIELAKAHFDGGSIPSPSGAGLSVHEKADSVIPVALKMSPTEERNPLSKDLDRLPLGKAIELMAQEDAQIPNALLKEKRNIERAIKLIVKTLKKGGRLFYVGAGTSGRLGVLDASEVPPTFRAKPEQVQGIIAGGYSALWNSVEGAEDSVRQGAAAIESRGVSDRDVVVGIAASGRTPFVWGALSAAKERGAHTIFLSFNPHLKIARAHCPDVVIAPNVGPEVLTGSTRLKAGTATKMVLNMLTTLSMVRLGKVKSNLMVDVNASNQKLRERAIRIVQTITGTDENTARKTLEQSDWIVKTACRKVRKK